MDKQREIKSLTWKYFWEQKLDELGIPIIWFLLSITLSFGFWIIIIYSSGDIYWILSESIFTTLFFMYIAGMFVVLLTGLVIAIIYVLIFNTFIVWLKDNWREANQKAKREVNKKAKRGKK